MDRIGKLAEKVAKSHNLKSEMDSAFVLQKMQALILVYWGEKGLKNLKPQKIIFNQVYVKATNSAWAQELQLRKYEILQQLNEAKIKNILEVRILL